MLIQTHPSHHLQPSYRSPPPIYHWPSLIKYTTCLRFTNHCFLGYKIHICQPSIIRHSRPILRHIANQLANQVWVWPECAKASTFFFNWEETRRDQDETRRRKTRQDKTRQKTTKDETGEGQVIGCVAPITEVVSLGQQANSSKAAHFAGVIQEHPSADYELHNPVPLVALSPDSGLSFYPCSSHRSH